MEGVRIKEIKQIPDERGRLFEILRSDEPIFEKFGQVYITTTYPGVVKAWHLHKKQTDYIVCIQGMIKLVIYDDRENSSTKGKIEELFIGENNLLLVVIPPGLWHGWKAIGTKEAIVINIPTEPYNRDNPDEFRLPPTSELIPYNWQIKQG
ncbi:MAG: dTDP-4-dehydrorhamnose 3,5-epimerase family protein [bacterium]